MSYRITCLGLLIVSLLVLNVTCEEDNVDKPQQPEDGNEVDQPKPKPDRDIPRRILGRKSWMIIPVLIGILLKFAAALPIIFAVAVVFSSISLLASKMSLVISAYLGAKSLIQLLNSPGGPSWFGSPVSGDSLRDIHNLMNFQQQEAWKPKPLVTAESFKHNFFHTMAPINVDLYTPQNYFPVTAADLSRESPLDAEIQESRDPIPEFHAPESFGVKLKSKRAKQKASEAMAASVQALLKKHKFNNPDLRRNGVVVKKTVRKQT